MRQYIISIVLTIAILLLSGCSATRYVPQGEYLLSKNVIQLNSPKGVKVSSGDLLQYVQQQPNRRLLGMGIYLGFYNITDTAKHSGWHKFWGEKIGEAPVILDTSKIQQSNEEMQMYLKDLSYLNAEVSDTVKINKKRKATVEYQVNTGASFMINEIKYDIKDDFIAPILMADIKNSVLKPGQPFQRSLLESERLRITNYLRDRGFWAFNQNYINYVADSTLNNNTVNVKLVLSQMVAGQDEEGDNIMINHPIYRVAKRSIIANYDPMIDPDDNAENGYDTVRYRGVNILYNDKLQIKEKLLFEKLGIANSELFSQSEFEQTSVNIRSLDLNPTILFTPLPVDSSNIILVTTPDGEATTTQRELDCLVQCIPNVKQNFSVGFEASTTSDYYSLALTFGYQNRNLFKGAENFNVSVRGAYEFIKSQQGRNSFEFGVESSISIPRFWFPISPEKLREFSFSTTNLSLAYDIQRRPYYERTIVSAKYGYGWTLKNGARFTINPADINLVDVPWIDEDYKESIENPYLRNSYNTQLIAGLSATYNFRTNPDLKKNGFAFNVAYDMNGNLFYGLNELLGTEKKYNTEGDYYYYNLFGLQFAQYARLIADVSNRVNIGQRTQMAWRLLGAGGYAYGNSRSLPFERLFFAGGSNSMRGWQVRTLGPGGVHIEDQDEFPDQLGDMRLEANLEFRFDVIGGLNTALFFDCGNIWMNGEGESRENANFRFNRFYKELAFNTGVGIRYDFDFFILRLDWGIKLRNPNNRVNERWFRDLSLDKTALHFAIGLPF